MAPGSLGIEHLIGRLEAKNSCTQSYEMKVNFVNLFTKCAVFIKGQWLQQNSGQQSIT
jgi:hypothetical protein